MCNDTCLRAPRTITHRETNARAHRRTLARASTVFRRQRHATQFRTHRYELAPFCHFFTCMPVQRLYLNDLYSHAKYIVRSPRATSKRFRPLCCVDFSV